MLPSSFLPSVVWMTIDKNYGTIENICWRINTNSLSLHQRKEKELITNIKTDKIMKKYVCTVCNWIYDPAVGDPDSGIAPGTPFEAIPDDWACPLCGVRYPFGRNLNERLQDVPYGENVTNRTTQDKEMEDGVHIGALVERVEQRSGYVTSTFADNPSYGTWAYGIHQRLESYKYD